MPHLLDAHRIIPTHMLAPARKSAYAGYQQFRQCRRYINAVDIVEKHGPLQACLSAVNGGTLAENLRQAWSVLSR